MLLALWTDASLIPMSQLMKGGHAIFEKDDNIKIRDDDRGMAVRRKSTSTGLLMSSEEDLFACDGNIMSTEGVPHGARCYPCRHVHTPDQREGVRPHASEHEDIIARLNSGVSDADLCEFVRMLCYPTRHVRIPDRIEGVYPHMPDDEDSLVQLNPYQEKRERRAWARHTADGHPGMEEARIRS